KSVHSLRSVSRWSTKVFCHKTSRTQKTGLSLRASRLCVKPVFLSLSMPPAKIDLAMPSGPRQLLEQRIPEISTELEVLFEGACDDARREQAEQLNQPVRRLRIAPDAGELCATLADAAARLADGAILFRVSDGTASSDRID